MKRSVMPGGWWPQYMAALTVFLIALVCASEIGWTTPFIGIQLNKMASPIPMTKAEVTWVASLINLGQAVGGTIGTIGIILFGSKTALFHTGAVQVVSLACLAVADSSFCLLVSRFIGGLATGIFYVSFPLYIHEISNPAIEGILITTISNGMSIGYVIGNLIGAYLSIQAFALLMLAVTGTFLVSFYCFPHSPHHLVMTDQPEEAATAIRWYEDGVNVENRLLTLQRFAKDKHSMTCKNLLKELLLYHNTIPLFSVITMYGFMQLGGVYTVRFYMENILQRAQVITIDPPAASIIISSIGLIGGWFAMYFIDIFGRKAVLLISNVGIALSLIGLALHYHCLEMDYDPLRLQWLIISSAILLEFFVNLGIMPIPSTVMGDLFAPNIRIYCCCIVNMTSAFISFLHSQTYLVFIDSLDYYVYYVYALMMISAFSVTLIHLPNTAGRSPEEIQKMLMKNS